MNVKTQVAARAAAVPFFAPDFGGMRRPGHVAIAHAPDDAVSAPTPVGGNLSFSEGLALLRERGPAPAVDNSAPDVPAAGEASPEPQDQPNPAEAAPPATEPSGETEAKVDGPAETPPTVEAPKFWDAAYREKFKTLPPDVQQYILERETERDRAVRTQQNEAAQAAKAVQAKEAEASALVERLSWAVQTAAGQLQKDFADIRSPEDAVRLASQDPNRYLQFRARVDALQAAAAAEREQRARAEEAAIQQAEQALRERFPDWAKDEAKGRKEITELREFAAQTYRVPAEVAAQIADPAIFEVLKDAMAYRKGQQALQQARASAPATPTVQPGAARSPAEMRAADLHSVRMKLQHSGSLEDAKALLRAKRG